MEDKRKEVDRLVQELFGAVQTSQGYFYVSDGETFATRAEFFERIRGRLDWGREAVAKMNAFLRKHGEAKPTTPPSTGKE